MGSTGYKEVYTYDEDDGSLLKITVEGDIQDANLVYDALRRLHQVTTDTYTKTYSYRDISSTRTTTQITGLTYTGLFNHTFGYTYNALGYISTYSPKVGETIQYGYDAQGQLTSVTVGDQKTVYTYDSVGNILSVKQGDAFADPATYSSVGSYTYDNSSWRDLLTRYNGGVIAYEGQTYNAQTNTVTGDPVSGNPISLSFLVCFTIISPTGNNSPFANGVLQLY